MFHRAPSSLPGVADARCGLLREAPGVLLRVLDKSQGCDRDPVSSSLLSSRFRHSDGCQSLDQPQGDGSQIHYPGVHLPPRTRRRAGGWRKCLS